MDVRRYGRGVGVLRGGGVGSRVGVIAGSGGACDQRGAPRDVRGGGCLRDSGRPLRAAGGPHGDAARVRARDRPYGVCLGVWGLAGTAVRDGARARRGVAGGEHARLGGGAGEESGTDGGVVREFLGLRLDPGGSHWLSHHPRVRLEGSAFLIGALPALYTSSSCAAACRSRPGT